MIHQLNEKKNLKIKDTVIDQLNRCKKNLYKSIAKRIVIFADDDEYIDHFKNEEKLYEDIIHQSLDSKYFHRQTNYIIEFLYHLPYAIFIIILFVVVLSIISRKFYRHDDNNNNNIMENGRRMARCNSSLLDRRAIFFTIFEDTVRNEFKSQSAETMSTIVTAVSHILLPNPERPSILILLSSNINDKDNKNTCVKIARATASAVISSFQKPSKHFHQFTINCSNYQSSDEFWKFYEQVSERMNRYKVVILEEFDKLNGQVATALCHLADDTYAPFPQSILIACLDIGNRFNKNYLERQEPVTIAEKFLEEKWDGIIDRLTMQELFGRLTGRIVFIERDDIPFRRLNAGSLHSIEHYSIRYYSGPPSSLRRRRRIARSQMQDVVRNAESE